MFRLRILDGPRAGEVILLDPAGAFQLGRGHEASVRFAEDASMSRLHCELKWDGQAWVLWNKSQHGTRVGAVVVESAQRLVPGDAVKLGATHLVFERADAAVPAPAPAPAPPRPRPVSSPPVAAPPPAPAAPGAGSGSSARTPVASPALPPPVTPAPVTPGAGPPEAVAPGAVAPEGAGYDAQGVFHMGFTMMQPALDPGKSAIFLSKPTEGRGGVKVKKRTIVFLLVLLAFTSLGCCCGFFDLFFPMLQQIPGPLLLASFFALLPTVPYLALYKLLDRNGQIPLRNYLACFLWGASVGCGFSVVMNDTAKELFQSMAGQAAGDLMTAVLAAPFFEESTKGLAVLVVFLILEDEFDNAVEGMILGAAAGLGFALVENCVYDSMFLVKGNGDFGQFFVNGTYRMLTCALIGHPVYTSMTGLGFGLAREWGKKGCLRFLLPPAGWMLAVAMHALWNGSAGLLIPALFGDHELAGMVALAVFVGGGCLAFFLFTLTYSLWKERQVLLRYLSDEVEKGFIEAAELESFRSLFGRERFVFGGLGKGTRKLRKELRRAQLDLAFRKWHLAQGDRVKGQDVDRDLLDARIRIRDARNAINAKEGRTHARTV